MKAFKVICFILFFSLVFIYPFITYADSNSDYLNKKDKQAYEYYGSLSEEEFRQLSLDEFIDAIRQNAIVAMEKGEDATDDFAIGIGYILGDYFDGWKEALTDRVYLAYNKVIQDKSEPWLLREVLMNWSYPPEGEDSEIIEASSISPSTWLKLLKTAQSIMQDKQDNLEIRKRVADLITGLLPRKNRTFIDESILQDTWQDILRTARQINKDNTETIAMRACADTLVPEIIKNDYERLKKNELVLLFASKDELLNELQQDINKRIDLFRDPSTPSNLRYTALGGLTVYYTADVPQSLRIKQEVITTFYEEKQREDKKFCLWITYNLINWYKDYSIKPALKEMYEQGNLDKETKNKLRNLIDDIEILEEAEED